MTINRGTRTVATNTYPWIISDASVAARLECGEAFNHFLAKVDRDPMYEPGSPENLPWDSFELRAGRINAIVLPNYNNEAGTTHRAQLFEEFHNREFLAMGVVYFNLADSVCCQNTRANPDIENCHSINRALWRILCLVIRLILCKNVGTRDVNPDERLNRSRIRKGKAPKLSYKTLTISPGYGSFSRSESKGASGLTVLHLSRGHFKIYGPEAPLFGKHVGRFWWAPSMRGSATNGVVHKDYRLSSEFASQVDL